MLERRVLFVTWDGPQTDYLETLFLPIFERLGALGWCVDVLQFGWGDAERTERARLLSAEENWDYYHRRVLRLGGAIGSAITILWNARSLANLVAERKYAGIVCRSIFPAAMTLLSGARVEVLYDSDGLAMDERVEFQGWSVDSVVYNILRAVEASIVRRASSVLNRTVYGNEVLQARAGPVASSKFLVSTNGRDSELFDILPALERVRRRGEMGVPEDGILLVHSGSIGPQYCPGLVLDFFQKLFHRAPSSRLLILSRDPGALLPYLEALESEVGSAILFRSCSPQEVPGFLGLADLGLSFREDSFSMGGVEPLKVGEYLLCGVPVLSYGYRGRLEQLEVDSYGFELDSRDEDVIDRLIERLLSEMPASASVRTSCRELGQSLFSLERAVSEYREALELAFGQSGQS